MSRMCTLGLVWTSALLTTGALLAPSTHAASCRLAGRWLNDGATRKIALASSDDRWFATLVWTVESKVQTPSLMLKDFVYDAKADLYRGRLLGPAGPDVPAELKCIDDDTFTLTGHRGLLSRTFTWHRARD